MSQATSTTFRFSIYGQNLQARYWNQCIISGVIRTSYWFRNKYIFGTYGMGYRLKVMLWNAIHQLRRRVILLPYHRSRNSEAKPTKSYITMMYIAVSSQHSYCETALQLTDHGQNDVCSFWMRWHRWQLCILLVTPWLHKDFNPQPELVYSFYRPRKDGSLSQAICLGVELNL